MLDAKQKEFFSSMDGTFTTPGWALLTQGWQEEQDSLPAMMFFNAKTMEDVEQARVRFGLLNELISLPQTIAAQREHIEGQEDDSI